MALFYAGNLAEPLEFGHVIVISGRTTPDASRVDINLAKGKKPEDHIGLHMSFRMDENAVIRNDYNGTWGREERDENKHFNAPSNPMRRGETFQIYILVGDLGFNVAVNGDAFCTFEHRMACNDLKAMTIYFNVEAITGIDHRRVFPQPHPVIQCNDDSVAFSHDFPDLPRPGDVVVISAVPVGNPMGRFEVQFNQGCNTDKEALHISTRFDESCVVRNDRDDEGCWGEEEIGGPPFPFVINQLFRMAIAFGESFFRIAINGSFFCDFQYRNNDVLDDFNGFTVDCIDGLQLVVRGIDHMKSLDRNCEGFHAFSNPYDPLVSNV